MKKFLYIFLILCVAFSLTGCKPRAMIIFNKEPITKENLLDNVSEFTAGKRIYYLFFTTQKLDSPYIRVRVLKRAPKVYYDFSGVVYSNDYRLRKDQVFYYDDYIVMNEPGHYFMEIYDRYSLERPLACADFLVK